ncbi:hypothetical protein PENANT_c057G10728 [Penicillium antarcticum]|uniref:Uncharacterized protein n=1 Tax=Penicillium antarcticum TaxID=416450 RepID=A0A1V6PQM7_9EURO|nr:hypothetical protein PENANT_c057G10728 [Penicillium antarcticum]
MSHTFCEPMRTPEAWRTDNLHARFIMQLFQSLPITTNVVYNSIA